MALVKRGAVLRCRRRVAAGGAGQRVDGDVVKADINVLLVVTVNKQADGQRAQVGTIGQAGQQLPVGISFDRRPVAFDLDPVAGAALVDRRRSLLSQRDDLIRVIAVQPILAVRVNFQRIERTEIRGDAKSQAIRALYIARVTQLDFGGVVCRLVVVARDGPRVD